MPLPLSVVTPTSVVVDVSVDSVVLPGSEGEFGVLPRHERFLAPLQAGTVSYQAGGVTHHLRVSGGFSEVSQEGVVVLADEAEEIG